MSLPDDIRLDEFIATPEGSANSDGRYRWRLYGPTTIRLGVLPVERVVTEARVRISDWRARQPVAVAPVAVALSPVPAKPDPLAWAVVDPDAPEGRCRIMGCSRDVASRGCCLKHYDKARNYGVLPDGRLLLDVIGLPKLSPSEVAACGQRGLAERRAPGAMADALARAEKAESALVTEREEHAATRRLLAAAPSRALYEEASAVIGSIAEAGEGAGARRHRGATVGARGEDRGVGRGSGSGGGVNATENTVGAALDAVNALAMLARQSAAEWIPAMLRDGPEDDARENVPHDERKVLVFLNGHVDLCDDAGRKGGGWGMRTGFYDHDRNCWYVGGQRDGFVTHWMEVPAAPALATWPPVVSAQ